MNPLPKIEVVAAVVRNDTDGRILITRRHDDAHLGGLWEFPGGKVEAKESLASALTREIQEELGIGVEVGTLLVETTRAYPDRIVHLHFFECRLGEGVPTPRGVAAIVWCTSDELDDFPMPEANGRVIKMLQSAV